MPLRSCSGWIGNRVMDRRAFIGTPTGGLLAAPLTVEAQQARRPIIGVTLGGSQPNPYGEALRLALAERGWIDGQNVRIEYRYAEGRPDRYPGFFAELLRLNVDVIVAGGGTVAALAARRATHTTPTIVFVPDPVAASLAASLARPGSVGRNLRASRFSQCWRSHVVWPEHRRDVSAGGDVRGQDPQRRQAERPPHRAAHQVRTGHQPQDRQGPRPDDPTVAPAAGGSGDRVMDRRTFLGTLAGGLLAAPLAAEAQGGYKPEFKMSVVVNEETAWGRAAVRLLPFIP